MSTLGGGGGGGGEGLSILGYHVLCRDIMIHVEGYREYIGLLI